MEEHPKKATIVPVLPLPSLDLDASASLLVFAAEMISGDSTRPGRRSGVIIRESPGAPLDSRLLSAPIHHQQQKQTVQPTSFTMSVPIVAPIPPSEEAEKDVCTCLGTKTGSTCCCPSCKDNRQFFSLCLVSNSVQAH